MALSLLILASSAAFCQLVHDLHQVPGVPFCLVSNLQDVGSCMHSLLWGSDHQHLIVIVMLLQEAEVLNGRIAMVAFATLVSPCTSFGCRAHNVYALCFTKSCNPCSCIVHPAAAEKISCRADCCGDMEGRTWPGALNNLRE